MMNTDRMALIVGQRGPLWDSLGTFLMTLPAIDMVLQMEDAVSALRIAAEQRPSLVVLDAGQAGDEILPVLAVIGACGLAGRCLVLADDGRQQRQAASAGVGAAVLKGYPAAKLLEMTESLLPDTAGVVDAG
jgi:DNA-binding NarL/FixJ family response regulator